jgi:pyruvate dehydrogenase E1 component alpha subunit
MAAGFADQPDRTLGLGLFRTATRIRKFEERVAALQAGGQLPGAVHLCIGQEAIAAGVCAALREDDFITSHHRGHGHVIAKGGDIGRCMAELFARETGYNRGKGGSMHLANMSLGIIGANGIVGAGIALATGAGLSAQMRGTDQVSVCFFGDGAANEGTFHESFNLAAIWSLPVVYVCENNGYGELTRTEKVTALGAVAQRGAAYGIPAETVDGNDAFVLHRRATEAIARARRGDGPTLIEAKTFRIRSHAEGLEMYFPAPATDEELDAWRRRDPVRRLRIALEESGALASDLDAIETDAVTEIDAGLEFAIASPVPAPDSAFDDMWTEPTPSTPRGGVA